MGVSRALLLLLCLGALLGVPAAESGPLPGKIRAASEEWADYTQADGQGMGWDILRAVFEPEGVKLEIRSVPYTRSIGLVQRGEVDAQVGAYRDETEGLLYPHWHYDVDHIYALGLASSRHRRWRRLAIIDWCGCAGTNTTTTCPTSGVSMKFTAPWVSCRCWPMIVPIFISMR